MAKTPSSKQRPAPDKTSGKGPVKGGRPAGLFTWLAVGLVVVVVAALVIIKVASGGNPTGGSSTFQPANPTTVSELTSVPTSIFNTVGVSSPVVQVTPPQAISSQPLLSATNTQGTKVPEVLYIGAEYCPYCAAQRWSTIVALSRFGTWKGLGDMLSSSSDTYPNTPTFTFLRAAYSSPYLVFKSVELYTRYIDPATNYYKVLQKPTASENALIKKYDSPAYIKGMTANQAGSIPFLTFANKFLVAGASYSPTTLAGSSRSQIAAGLSSASSPITDAIIASANFQTAALCTLTKDQPSNVCTTAGVKAANKVMGIK